MVQSSTLEIASSNGTLTITPARAMMHGNQVWSIPRTAIEQITLDRRGGTYDVTLHLTDGRGFVVRGVSMADAHRLAAAFNVPMALTGPGGSLNSGVTGGPATRPLPQLSARRDALATYRPAPGSQNNKESTAESELSLNLTELAATCIQGRFIITPDHVALIGDNGWLVPRWEVAGVMPRRGTFGCDLAVTLRSGVTRWLDGLAYPDAVSAIELLGIGGDMQLGAALDTLAPAPSLAPPGDLASPTLPDERHRTPSLYGLPELPEMPPALGDASPTQRPVPPLTSFARQAPTVPATSESLAPTQPPVALPEDVPEIPLEQPGERYDDAGIPHVREEPSYPAVQSEAQPEEDDAYLDTRTRGPLEAPPGEFPRATSGLADEPIASAESLRHVSVEEAATPPNVTPPDVNTAEVATGALVLPNTLPSPSPDVVPSIVTDTMPEAPEAPPADAPAEAEAPEAPSAEESSLDAAAQFSPETQSDSGIAHGASSAIGASSEPVADQIVAPPKVPTVSAPPDTGDHERGTPSLTVDESERTIDSFSPASSLAFALAWAGSASERGASALKTLTVEKPEVSIEESDAWSAEVTKFRGRDYTSMATGAVLLIATLLLALRSLQPLPQVHIRTHRGATAIPTATAKVSPAAQPSGPGARLAEVLAGSHDGTVYAFSPYDGRLLWQYRIGAAMESAPTLGGNTVFVGSDDHSLYALDLSSHNVLWRSHVEGNITTPPTVSGSVVYTGDSAGYLYALDTANGAPLWRAKANSWFAGQPAAYAGTIYAGSYDGSLYAIRATDGAVRWRYHTGGAVASSPIVVGGIVYTGSNDGALYAFDAASGVLRWRYQTGGSVYSSPAVVNGTVYVGSFDGAIYALRASDGLLLWRHQTGALVSSSPAVVEGAVYVGSGDGNVYSLRTQDGAQLWAFKTRNAVSSSPAVADGAVYVGSSDHTVYALSAANGSLLWSHQTSDTVNWRPAIVP